jgi:predicted kinase
MLVAFSGLPGVGKSEVARRVARALGAAYLRIDTVEVAICPDPETDVGAAGYAAAFAVARENLSLGLNVVGDSVNPVADSRQGWRRAAEAAGAVLLNVEMICSDAAEHRRRVEGRTVDVPGLVPPTWPEVVERRYEPWTEPILRIDTAKLSVEEAAAAVLAAAPTEGQ